MSTVGDILSTVGGVQYHGDIMSTVGGYLEYRGGCSVLWGDIMSTMGVFSTMGGYHPLKFEYHGGYHDTCGGIS